MALNASVLPKCLEQICVGNQNWDLGHLGGKTQSMSPMRVAGSNYLGHYCYQLKLWHQEPELGIELRHFDMGCDCLNH